MKTVIKLAVTDFKLIFRSPSLRGFLVLPILLYVLIVWFVPGLVEKYDFLTPYLPVFLVIGVIENTQTFCFISSMVLIDEKETEVARLYGVVPLTHIQYLFSRMLIPFLFTVLLNVGLLAIQPFYPIHWAANLTISLITACVVPVYVLGINALVKNRMEGLIYIKAFNIVVLVPVAAFFLPQHFSPAFGIFPTHWIFQSIANVTAGLPIVGVITIGSAYFLLLLIFVSKAFLKKHFI
jgi:fluoroquinolone transport system permease protein